MTMMSDIVVVEDHVDMQCMRHVHWMSNSPTPVPSPNTADADLWRGVQWEKEAGAWHLRTVHPFRGVLDIETGGGVKFRRFVAWSLEGCGNVREALRQAKAEYVRLFGGSPQFGFMRSLPRGVEWFTEFDGLLLLDSEWMLERAVAVGGRWRSLG